jgi:hypothetical protein
LPSGSDPVVLAGDEHLVRVRRSMMALARSARRPAARPDRHQVGMLLLAGAWRAWEASGCCVGFQNACYWT